MMQCLEVKFGVTEPSIVQSIDLQGFLLLSFSLREALARAEQVRYDSTTAMSLAYCGEQRSAQSTLSFCHSAPLFADR